MLRPAGPEAPATAGASRRRRVTRHWLAALITSVAPFSAAAQPPATGGLAGVRNALEDRGVALGLAYAGEVFGNLRGGIRPGAGYRGDVELVLVLDFEKLGLWRGGRLVARGENGHGRGISEHRVGDLQLLSDLEAHSFTQLSELWLEQRFLDGRIRLKLGKQDANEDFSASVFGADCLHSSFGVIPTAPVPTFPDPALGAAFFAEPAPWVSFGLGVYDGEPDGRRSGFATAFDGEGGTFSVLEWEIRGALGRDRSLPGHYRGGAWYHSGEVEELARDPSPATRSANYGLYLFFDQWLYREPAGEGGLGLFAQFGWAPADRNEVTRYWGGGLSYAGLLPGRGADVAGVGVAHARLSTRLAGAARGDSESAIEFFYRAQLTPRVSVQPDLQIIVRPGGNGRNALAAGLRLELHL